MADWRQIRARIRRAKSGPDPTARLEQLFDKTRDGMVAFELAQLEETAGRIERATDWYIRAWQRFRRSEWKQKAEEALTRHGIPIPTNGHEEMAEEPSGFETPAEEAAAPVKEPEREEAAEAEEKPEAVPEAEGMAEAEAAQPEGEAPPQAPEAKPETPEQAEAAVEPAVTHRRRRRRGGRGRGKKAKGEAAAKPAVETPPAPARPPAHAAVPKVREPEHRPAAERRPPREPAREPARERIPPIHIYRRGEPALASEIKTLEAKLRQLLASHPYSLDQLNEVPASPGVYLVSDLDLTTMYYLEAFGNMRSAMDQLVSGRRGRQGSVRARLARYLGISDAQASRYLKQHCVVRWLELEDTDAIALGHFAAALLRPELMEELA